MTPEQKLLAKREEIDQLDRWADESQSDGYQVTPQRTVEQPVRAND